MVYPYPRIPITAQPMGVRVWVLMGKSTGSPQDTRGLPVQLPMHNIDGTLNVAGSITEVVDLVLRYWKHSERTLFAVTTLGKQKLILGHSWLCKHNPEIDWSTGEVKMSQCPPHCCSEHRDEARQERLHKKAEVRRMEAISTGLAPRLVEECEEEEVDEEDSIDVGDRIFATGLLPSPLHVQVNSSISQQLAEAFKLNLQMAPMACHIPEYLQEFDSVFSKELFDVLPESKKWDHAIKLIPGEKASNCKCSLDYAIALPRSRP